LKTLEEPPPHVVFILCTTEAHKLPQTILSRVLRLDFHPIASELLTKYFTKVIKSEMATASPEAISLIASMARGSVRDGLSLLESVLAYTKKIEISDVEVVLGSASGTSIDSLVAAIEKKDVEGVRLVLGKIFSKSINTTSLTTQVMEKLKDNFALSKSAELMRVYKIFAEVEQLIKSATDPRVMFEGACYTAII